MKIDGLGVVFAIILLPIILVMTYYIQLQVDTIAMENEYNSKLLSATYDAMAAFEMNTANEKLSSVADSMRSIILASNNVFFDSLANNMGISNASQEYIRPYVPAVLYTMYDGYYIYAPTQTEKVAEKVEETEVEDQEKIITTKGYLSVGDKGVTYSGVGNYYNYDSTNHEVSFKDGENFSDYGALLYEVKDQDYLTTDKSHAEKQTDYLLKSYMQYSARYKKGEGLNKKDVIINYTLDNYLNIIGTIGEVYYTKTGYLIKKGLVTSAKINGTDYSLETNNENDAKNKILGLKTNTKETTIDAANTSSVTVGGVTINANFEKIKNITNSVWGVSVTTITEAEMYLEKFYVEYDETNDSAWLAAIQELEYEIQNCRAVAYYTSSAIFSNWVYENLGDLSYGDIADGAMVEFYANKDDEGNANPIYNSTSGLREGDLYYNFHNNAVKNKTIFDNTQDPEYIESNFNTHRVEVIKNSIKYNLNLSISAYRKMNGSYEFSLPMLLDEELDKIISNMSIVSFMQGLDCGLNIYNNYQIVPSTNNELTVTPSEIYYVKKSEFNNGAGIYHRIDCPHLAEDENGYISFKSKEVKYDKVYDKAKSKYKYDHKNLACYTCINNSNYESLFLVNSKAYYEKIKNLKKVKDSVSADSIEKKKVAYIAIASERQDIYKTNALPISQGFEIVQITSGSNITNEGNVFFNPINLQNVTGMQITFAETKSNATETKEPILNLTISINGQSYNVTLNLDQTKEQTVMLNIGSSNTNISSIKVQKSAPGYNVNYKIKGIKVIYK